MSQRLAGVCYCKIDGDMIDLEGSITITPEMVSRTQIVSSTGVIGYTEENKAPKVEITGYLNRAQLRSLMDNTDITVTAECANGVVYTLSGALVSGDVTIDAQAGTTSITFEGERGEFL